MKKLCCAVATTLMMLVASTAFAQPPGVRGPEIGKQLWNFNVIVRPNGWVDTGNACNGNRIFFTETGGGPGVMGSITWLLEPDVQPDFQLVDCNGTDDTAAAVRVNENLGDFIVAIRLMGPKTSQLKFVCQVIANPTATTGEELCPLDPVIVKNKDREFTRVLKNIAEKEFENVLWTFDSSTTWKIFQVRVFEWKR